MPRGFTWSVYLDDTGAPWALQVDSEYAVMLERGWGGADPTGLDPFPRTWKTRKVRGLEESGRSHHAVVADLSAPLWTGEATTFTIIANDGTPILCTVVELFAEKRTAPAPDPI